MKFKIGEKLHFYTTTDSTQNNAKDLLAKVQEKDIEDVINLAIVGIEQVRGYGRRGNLWYSPAGGLWCSIIVDPIVDEVYLQNSYQLSIIACIAAVQSLENLYNLNLSIKWPNDIMCQDRKLGGVLVEIHPCRRGDVTYYFPIIGIGINVNNEIPKEVSKIAISVKNVLSSEVNIIELLTKLLKTFNYLYYNEYKCFGLSNLIHFYRKKNYIISRRIKVMIDTESSSTTNRDMLIEGIVANIDDDGRLLLLTDDNSLLKMTSGHIFEEVESTMS